MPSTRRSAGGRPQAASGRQSTLSFNHRVTKSVPKDFKDAATPPPVLKQTLPKREDSARPRSDVDDDDVDATSAPGSESEEEAEAPLPVVKSTAELKAEKMGDAAIERYWRKLESERVAKRVHQEGLPTGEKLLRYFDVSSQYGPCIGITRTKRWQRAQRLGLNPPVEVLAVLLRRGGRGDGATDKAHMDEIMNPTAAAS